MQKFVKARVHQELVIFKESRTELVLKVKYSQKAMGVAEKPFKRS